MAAITKEDIAERLRSYAPPVGSAYYMRRHPNRAFSEVGFIFTKSGASMHVQLFDIYTGSRERYLWTRDTMQAIADEWNSKFYGESWGENESQSSETVIAVSSGPGCSGGTRCGAGVGPTCTTILDDIKV